MADSEQLADDAAELGPGAPFELTASHASTIPVLIAVPHAGRHYSAPLLARMRNRSAATVKLEDRLVDRVAQEVAARTGSSLLVAKAPRALIDLNRAPDDIDWSMVEGVRDSTPPGRRGGARARGGLGLVPRRLPQHGEIWRGPLPLAQLRARIDGVHRPYHAALAKALVAIRSRWGAALLLDLHSMPPLPGEGAQFVIGDRFGSSCAGFVPAIAFDTLAAAGRPTAHNRPYAGGYVLDRHGAPSRNVHAVQLEVCRAAYLDEGLLQIGPGFNSVVDIVTRLVRRLAAEVAAQGGERQAAAE